MANTALVSLVLTVAVSLGESAVLLVSFDGFRWDYLQEYRAESSWFWEVKNNGTAAKYGGMNGTFATVTFPSHVTMSTGLYEESHGIVSNVMYDPKFNATFSYRSKADNEDPKWWREGEPIWIAAQRQGKKSGTYFWPGSETSYNGVMQTFWKPYNVSVPFKDRVDTVVNWLANEGAELVTLYFNEPDSTGHTYGPFSPQMRDAVKNCNDVLGYLITKMRAAKVYDSTNLIIVSDHGMAECTKSKIISLFKVLEEKKSLYKMIVNTYGIVLDIVPNPGQKQALYEHLSQAVKSANYSAGLTVYRKEDLPDRYHYKNNRRVADIVLVANEGYYIVTSNESYFVYDKFGAHGYDNELSSMKPIFMAQGPNINQKTQIPRIQQVDIYNLIANLLKIEPHPNNGSLDRIAGIMSAGNSVQYCHSMSLFTLPGLLLLHKVFSTFDSIIN